MTKYVINGGYISKDKDKERKYYDAIFKDTINPVILICPFTKTPEEQFRTYNFYKENLLKYNPNFKIKLSSVKNFIQDCEDATHVCFTGGLMKNVPPSIKESNIENILEGKTIFADSGGAALFSQYAWSTTENSIQDGLGVLAIKFIPHFNSDYGSDRPEGPVNWQEVFNQMKETEDRDMPIHALEEGEYVVIDK